MYVELFNCALMSKIKTIIFWVLFFYIYRQIKWNLSNIDSEHEKWLNNPGNILELPPNIFRGGQSYKLTAALVQSNDSKVLIYV